MLGIAVTEELIDSIDGDRDELTVAVPLCSSDIDITGLIDAFDVADTLGLVLEDSLADVVAKGDSVEYWLDVTDILEYPDVVNRAEAV